MRIVFLFLTTIGIHCEIAEALEPISETIAGIEAALAGDRPLIHHGHVVPIWLSDGDRFLYSSNGPDDLNVLLADPTTDQISRVSLDAQLRQAFKAVDDAIELTVEGYDDGDDNGKPLLLVRAGERLYGYDIQHGEVIAQTEHPLDHPKQISDQFPTTFGPLMEAGSPDGRSFVTVKKHNLYLRAKGSDDLRPLTTDGHLKETWLNTQESSMGFNVFWSPDSTRIATLQLDAREVWHEPVPHWLATPPRTEPIPYPRSGEPMHRFRPTIIHIDRGQSIKIDLGDTEDHYVDILGWRADGQQVFVRVTDREHHHVRLFGVDANSGQSTVLLEERRETYIDTPMLLSPKLFYPLFKGGFIHLIEQSGWRHIYRYDQRGKLVAKLTDGAWPVDQIVAIDEESDWIYFRASQDSQSPYHIQLYRVSLRGGEPELLTSGTGVNVVRFSPSRKYFITQRSSTTQTPVVELRHSDGRLIRILVEVPKNIVQASGFGGVEPFIAKSTDDRWDMHGVIVKPVGFDETKKYPVVEFIYGGMQARQTPHTFFGPLEDLVVRTLARRGFVVVIVDAPGTPGRGREFQDATYGIWPQTVITNHASAIRTAAQSRPWMDLTRVGIYGHSWGGYMAQRAMIDAPELYKAAVSHAAPSGFYDHPYYIEPFMGLPKNNLQGYAAASNLDRVDQIQGPVLSMPEPLDVNAGFSPGMKLVKAMIDARKDVELFTTPESNHGLRCCGEADYLYKVAVITRFLRRHLNHQ